MMPPPPKNVYKELTEDNLTYDKQRGRHRFRNPLTGKTTWWTGLTNADANEKARKANRAIRLQKAQLSRDPYTVSRVIDGYLERIAPYKPWSPSYRKNIGFKLARIHRELGKQSFVSLDVVQIADWIDPIANNADTFNKWREIFSEICAYAVSRKIAAANEGAKVLRRSTSVMLPENRKSRLPLTLDAFWWIYDRSPLFLQVATSLSFVTLQARLECVNLNYSDIRNNEMYVIRQKSATQSDYAFIRIEMSNQLRDIVQLSRSDSMASQHIVHRRSQRVQARKLQKLPFGAINDDYLSKAFAKMVKQAVEGGVITVPEGRTPPSFHEIRGLGSREYQKQGFPGQYIQYLLTHTDPKTSKIYTEGGQTALSDRDFKPVKAELMISR